MRNPINIHLRARVFALAAAIAAILALTAPPLHADIILDTAFPTVKQPARIHVTDDHGASVPNADVTAIYRPESAVERVRVVGKTAADGTFDWTPAEAGIVTITATWTGDDNVEHTTSANTSVKFDPTPIAGIIIMIVAGLLLIGGGLERIVALLRTPEAE